MSATSLSSFEALLQDWRQLLTNWASSGTLSHAAQEALKLEVEPQQLKELVKEWSNGDFTNLPAVVLLASENMPNAAGAYVNSTNTIYINMDWLHVASHAMVMSVLTEELGHHLDGLLNSIDTPGDEGYLFASLAMGPEATRPSYARTSDIESQVSINGTWHNAELSSIPYYLLASTSHDIINTTRIWGLDPTVYLDKDTYILIHGWRGPGPFNALGYSDPSEIGIVRALVEGQTLFPQASQRYPFRGRDQGLLEVCLNSPGWVAAPTLYCAGTAPDPWPPSPPPRLLMQAI